MHGKKTDEDDAYDANRKPALGTQQQQPSQSFLASVKEFFLNETRKRQIILGLLFYLNYLFISNFLISGDPTLGETQRIQKILNTRSGSGNAGAATSNAADSAEDETIEADAWCYETVETRQQWRAAQRIAGPSFRKQIDLCSQDVERSLFDKNSLFDRPVDDSLIAAFRKNALSLQQTQAMDDILPWHGRTVLSSSASSSSSSSAAGRKEQQHKQNKKNSPTVHCGVHEVHMHSTSSAVNVSHVVVKDFIDYFQRTATEENKADPAKMIAARADVLTACSARKAGHLGQLPLLHTLRNAGAVADVALLHSVIVDDSSATSVVPTDDFDPPAHWEMLVLRADDGEDVSGVGALGSALLQTSALAAQNMAVHSCAAPVATIAQTVVVPSSKATRKTKKKSGKNNNDDGDSAHGDDEDINKGGEKGQNEIAVWRMWAGGPLVVAAVCRAPPFALTLEVSPSSSWVDIV